MTAADLIAFLRNHPKTCGVLGIIADQWPTEHGAYCIRAAGNQMQLSNHWGPASKTPQCFSEWLSGASTAKADEMGLDINETAHGWVGTTGREEERVTLTKLLPTRLHATFAAIEAALETT